MICRKQQGDQKHDSLGWPEDSQTREKTVSTYETADIPNYFYYFHNNLQDYTGDHFKASCLSGYGYE